MISQRMSQRVLRVATRISLGDSSLEKGDLELAITVLMLLMFAPCIINCLTHFVSVQVNKLQHATYNSSTSIYTTTPDHGKCHSPLNGHHHKDSEAWD